MKKYLKLLIFEMKKYLNLISIFLIYNEELY